MRDFRVWHHHRWGYFAYETNQLTLDGFVHRGDPEVLTNPHENAIGMFLVDYLQRRTVIRNADIQGAAIGIVAPVNRDVRGSSGPNVGITRIEDSLINAGLGIDIAAPWSVNGSGNLAPQTTILRNVRFTYPATRQDAHVAISPDGGRLRAATTPSACARGRHGQVPPPGRVRGIRCARARLDSTNDVLYYRGEPRGSETRLAVLDHASPWPPGGPDGLTIYGWPTTWTFQSGLFGHFQSRSAPVQVLRHAADKFVGAVLAAGLKRRGESAVRQLFERWLDWPHAVPQPGGCIFVAAATELDDKPGPARDVLVELHAICSSSSPTPRGPRSAWETSTERGSGAVRPGVYGIMLACPMLAGAPRPEGWSGHGWLSRPS